MKLMMKLFLILTGLVGLSLTGCSDSAPSGPVPSLGSATVKKYVAVGNSPMAGYQSAGLYQSAQMYSYPNLIAQQLAKAGASLGSFEQPYYSDPGAGCDRESVALRNHQPHRAGHRTEGADSRPTDELRTYEAI